MPVNKENRFQDFFEEGEYVTFKNHLYNYRLRKQAIERLLARERHELMLEIGSGISPVMTQTDRIVYSELSFLACRTLKHNNKKGMYVVADATRLPFKAGAFSHTISSEVIEHVPDDQAVLSELSRVLAPGGRLVLTFPHRKDYFANDDRYVNHFRRYDLAQMRDDLRAVGLKPLDVFKVLGPLEKLLMMSAVVVFETTRRLRPNVVQLSKPGYVIHLAEWPFAVVNAVLALIVRADAWIMPRALASCLLIEAEKK
jgi:SAM-dependent methyltransferase